MATEALRLSARRRPERASHRLDEALALERAMHKVMSTPLTLAPEDDRAACRVGQRAAVHPRPARPRAPGITGHVEALGLRRAPASAHSGARGREARRGSSWAADPARSDAAGVPSAALAVRGDAAGDVISPATAADADAFQASLRPMLLGVPRALALAVAAAAFMAFVLLAWFYS